MTTFDLIDFAVIGLAKNYLLPSKSLSFYPLFV
uniref:Uncharacterized protein n=1 Tax=Siphoviridae sp. ctbBv3 TaxID=2826392 RepID=A0A8S5NJ58_9CAUD|nr:MAG TPA: hypothetical protein [Siphoviridae sp. ctbBv3]DAF13141.1 MAG TPA: hypothetical protein [Caudoviricetes sp.]DAN60471.1 MAG TPA: hypothetical protein [Caudoviricetes sp.]DAX59772.1 MAG TPA: hypothetical protein [Caudoviricetes sp.]